MPNQTFFSCFLLFVATLAKEFFLLLLSALNYFDLFSRLANFEIQFDALSGIFFLFNTKNENDEVLKIDYLKMDHLSLKNYQIIFQFEAALKLNFSLLSFILYTIFCLLLIIFCFVDL